MYQVIAVSGMSKHGKDTFSDYIVKKHGFKKFSIADPLKEVCKIIFDFDDDQLYGDKKDFIDYRWKCTPRKCFQYIGTDLFRENLHKIIPDIEKNIWIKSLQVKIDKHFKENPYIPVVISDVRFENEIEYLRKSNLTVYSIRITNPRIKYSDNHESEEIKFNTNFTIINDSSLDMFYEKIDILFS